METGVADHVWPIVEIGALFTLFPSMNPLSSGSPSYNANEEIEKGKAAAIKILNDGCDIGAAFRHPTLGHISLLYGNRDEGIRHIAYKRKAESQEIPELADQTVESVVLKLIEVVVLGDIKPMGARRIIEYDGYRAILAGPKKGKS